jgi:isopentenyldiphosphate isomerase
MGEPAEELLNVYDVAGTVIGARRRQEAKASGLAVGAVNLLLVNRRSEVLLQRRPRDKENGGLWDKSVGGHVAAGEDFDTTVVREAAEELFDEPSSSRVRLATTSEEFRALLESLDLGRCVLLRPAARQLGLRDVRHAPGRTGIRIVLYHVAVYVGRTDVPRDGFQPQAEEIDDLRYFSAEEVDHLLVRGELSPNMAFLWLTQAPTLLGLVRRVSPVG